MMQQKQKRSKKIRLGVYLAAPFVAFYRALKTEVMSIDELEPKENQAIYFDFKQQIFLVEHKDKELIVKPTLLFYAGSEKAIKNFFAKFNEAFKNRKTTYLNEEFFAPLLESKTKFNNKPLLF